MPKKDKGLSEVVIPLKLKLQIKAAAKAKGIPMSELIRRAMVCWGRENGHKWTEAESPAAQ